MDYEQYDQWSENVRMEREEYVQEKLTAEEFQRKTDKPRAVLLYSATQNNLQEILWCSFCDSNEILFPSDLRRWRKSQTHLHQIQGPRGTDDKIEKAYFSK